MAAVVLYVLPLIVVFFLAQKRFMCRRKQDEARVNLRALLSLERDFHRRAGRYSSDLRRLEFNPEPGRYVYGFAVDTDGLGRHLVSTVRAPDRLPAASEIPRDTAAGKDRFRAGAAGHLFATTSEIDLWTIDEQGQLENLQDGCRWTQLHAFSAG